MNSPCVSSDAVSSCAVARGDDEMRSGSRSLAAAIGRHSTVGERQRDGAPDRQCAMEPDE